MKLVVERSQGRWYKLPWSALLYADESRLWIGHGIGATRNAAIRAAFTNAAERVISPPKKQDGPVHKEAIEL